MKILKASLLTVAMLLAIPSVHARQPLSEQKIKQAIIQESIDSYPGNCPCPYNSMRNGRACGGRSAYSRPGGYSPICYDSDVTPAMVKEYKARHAGG